MRYLIINSIFIFNLLHVFLFFSAANDSGSGVQRNRIGQVAHSVLVGTINVADRNGEAMLADLSRVHLASKFDFFFPFAAYHAFSLILSQFLFLFLLYRI